MIKIGVLSDTHLKLVNNVLRSIYDKYLADTDMIIHAGDIVSIEIIAFLEQKPFHGVSGNMDPMEVIGLLPPKKIIQAGKFRIGILHGWGTASGLEERVYSEFEDVDIIIFGHSHRPTKYTKNGVLLFNPGTATGHTSSGQNTIGYLELDDKINSEIIYIN